MKNKRTFGYIEVAFDIVYLITVFSLGIKISLEASIMPQYLYALMAFVLVFGDAFHLVPRITLALKKDKQQVEGLLGIGKMVTSVGMTVFYMLLFLIAVMLYMPEHGRVWIALAGGLTITRIVITLLPQNKWGGETETKWNIYRNIPFILLGGLTAFLFWYYGNGIYTNFRYMWIAILISFLCYLPVVLWVKKYPMIGMLMLPKSCAYVWIIAMGTGVF